MTWSSRNTCVRMPERQAQNNDKPEELFPVYFENLFFSFAFFSLFAAARHDINKSIEWINAKTKRPFFLRSLVFVRMYSKCICSVCFAQSRRHIGMGHAGLCDDAPMAFSMSRCRSIEGTERRNVIVFVCLCPFIYLWLINAFIIHTGAYQHFFKCQNEIRLFIRWQCANWRIKDFANVRKKHEQWNKRDPHSAST